MATAIDKPRILSGSHFMINRSPYLPFCKSRPRVRQTGRAVKRVRDNLSAGIAGFYRGPGPNRSMVGAGGPGGWSVAKPDARPALDHHQPVVRTFQFDRAVDLADQV